MREQEVMLTLQWFAGKPLPSQFHRKRNWEGKAERKKRPENKKSSRGDTV